MLVVARIGAITWPLARSRAMSFIIFESVRLIVWLIEPRSRRLKARKATTTTVMTESMSRVTTSATARCFVGFREEKPRMDTDEHGLRPDFELFREFPPSLFAD